VDSVNYGERPPIAEWRVPGANFHPKGMIHWGGDGVVSGHYVNNDFMLYHYYLTGDPRGPDFVKMWAEEFCRGVWVAEAERESTGPVSEIVYAYSHFRDPRWLKALNLFKDAMLSTPIAEHGIPWFNYMSWWRVHKYTADPRVAQLFAEQWADGAKPKRNGFGGGLTQALAFYLTGDRRILVEAGLGRATRGGRHVIPPVESHLWGEAAYLMEAFARIGASGEILLRSENRATWEAFWKADMEKWRKEGKKVYGKDP
jgi:hypothetical protein